jgi:hypothetical protein
MAVRQITPRVITKETGSAGRAGGGGLGQKLGAGLGAIAGGVTGFAAGGPGSAVAGAAKGATLGAGAGGLLGAAVAPGRADTRQIQQTVASQIPVQQLSQGSQHILDGIRALDNLPQSKSKYLQPLTEAYLQSQMELKRRG